MAQPVFKTRDGAIQLTIWGNESSEGVFYSYDLKRSYKQGDEWKETTSFTKKDAGNVAMLTSLAFMKITELEGD